ncbi:hypothetical protein [uncultured Clostridium sp.]|uniref:hypothetical protein n=1 Tax=uncultured Clostridium sp. TaxID=59620 RepID=UPI0028E9A555|nr:hypothetical protein [uncultured Clostridium sp.]
MNHRRVVEGYYGDINNLTELLAKLVNSYRLLVGGAGELNGIALARKKDVRDAIDRANDLGCVIDEIIDALEHCSCEYTNYCRIKGDVIKSKVHLKNILTEIDEELKLKD